MQCSHIFVSLQKMIPCSAGATWVLVSRGIQPSYWHRSWLWQPGGSHPVSPRPLAARAVKIQAVYWLLGSAEMFTGTQQLSLCTGKMATVGFAVPTGPTGGVARGTRGTRRTVQCSYIGGAGFARHTEFIVRDGQVRVRAWPFTFTRERRTELGCVRTMKIDKQIVGSDGYDLLLG